MIRGYTVNLPSPGQCLSRQSRNRSENCNHNRFQAHNGFLPALTWLNQRLNTILKGVSGETKGVTSPFMSMRLSTENSWNRMPVTVVNGYSCSPFIWPLVPERCASEFTITSMSCLEDINDAAVNGWTLPRTYHPVQPLFGHILFHIIHSGG